MTQLTLADAAQGAALKEAGQEAVELGSEVFIAVMRKYAREISLESGHVSTDNLRVVAQGLEIAPRHQNVWGCILKGPHWQAIGRQRSAWPSNHHRFVNIWRYVPRATYT